MRVYYGSRVCDRDVIGAGLPSTANSEAALVIMHECPPVGALLSR